MSSEPTKDNNESMFDGGELRLKTVDAMVDSECRRVLRAIVAWCEHEIVHHEGFEGPPEEFAERVLKLGADAL
jgi:hypothetical protein